MNARLLLVAFLTWGCSSGQTEPPAQGTEATEKKAPEKVTKTPPAPKKAAAVKTSAKQTPPAGKRKPQRPPIKWQDQLTWLSWDDARAKSAAEGKSICLVVYADWCPRCRELAPVFADPEVAKLAQGLVMVRQDQDLRPAWLQQFRDLGGYVPRILFFGPDGTLRRDIKSPHPRYPYFYTPRGADALKRSMRAALGG